MSAIYKWENSLLLTQPQLPDFGLDDEKLQKHHDGPNFFNVIQKVNNTELLYSDKVLSSKFFFQKYMMLRNCLNFYCILVIFLSLSSFWMTYSHADSPSPSIGFIMVWVTVMHVGLAALFVLTKIYYSYFLITVSPKNKQYLKSQRRRIIIMAILLLIHPIPFIQGAKIDIFLESYFTPSYAYDHFVRDVNQYLYLIEFIILFIYSAFLLLENNKNYGTRTYRICRMFGIKNDINYVLKCIISKNSFTFAAIIVVGGLVFFATIINITEIGYYTSLSPKDFDDPIQYESELKTRKVLVSYYNTMWYMIITITTAGYGDFYVRSTFTRIMIGAVAFYGSCNFALFILVITGRLSFSDREAKAYNYIKKFEIKKDMQEDAATAINDFFRYARCLKANDPELKKALFNAFVVSIKRFNQARNTYSTEVAFQQNTDLFKIFQNLEEKTYKIYLALEYLTKKNKTGSARKPSHNLEYDTKELRDSQ
jgi:hypothetical protein